MCHCLYNYGTKQTIRKRLRTRGLVTIKKMPLLSPNKNIYEETSVDPHIAYIIHKCVQLYHNEIMNQINTMMTYVL